MDWSATKNFLILGLIVTNLLLGYQIVKADDLFNQQNVEEDAGQITEIIDVLKNRNIFVELNKLTYYKRLPDLELAYESYSPVKVATTLLNGPTLFGDQHFEDQTQTLTFSQKRRTLVLAPKKTPVQSDRGNIAIATQVAKNYLVEKGYLDGMAIQTEAYPEPHGLGVWVIYEQKQDDLYLEGGKMRLWVYQGQVIGFERKWLKVMETKTEQRHIIPPGQALLNFAHSLEQPQAQPISIVSMTLGYRLAGAQFKGEITSGDAQPYWRITTGAGEVYFVEAVE